MSNVHYDLCIIGGGINGAGIARDAAGRGLSVLLVEANDLAGATSGASTKLIHGGLRYLEHGQLGMVRGALKERERLMNIAPHMISPLEFILPHDKAQRPEWMVRLGLFLYDNLAGGGVVPGSRKLDLAAEGAYGAPLRDAYSTGFSYYDCWTDDTRLVVLNALDAAERGAVIKTRTVCAGLAPEEKSWRITLRDAISGETEQVTAAIVVNATGPWARGLLNALDLAKGDPDLPRVRLVRGSHIILPRRFEGAHAYILQQPDKRIVFAIPYEKDYTLIGTTEEDDDDGNPVDVRISATETTYLCEAYNRFFEKEITPGDVLFTYSGVRPLIDDGRKSASSVSRGYRIYHHRRYAPPLFSVFGGKLTTYRTVAEKTVNAVLRASGRSGAPWTANWSLPGGDLNGAKGFSAFLEAEREKYPWLPRDLLMRYARAYGSRMEFFLQDAGGLEDLGDHYGDGVFAAEILYLVKYEWARTSEDILWRRSKLGLHVSDKTIVTIEKALPAILTEV